MRLDKNKVALLVGSDYGQQMLTEGDRAQAGNPEKEQVWMLLVSEIDPDPKQPRRHFNEAALNDLAADIVRRGVLQPIIVRPNSDRYQIVIGERRWRASQIAGKPRIPCLIRDLPETEVRQAQLVENVIREGISDIERGQSLHQLYEVMKSANRKVTWEQVAQIVGISRMRINHLYSLSSLPEAIADMIHTHRISGSHGLELARLAAQPETQLELAGEACRKENGTGAYGLSVAQLRQRINTLQGGSRGATSRKALSHSQIELYSNSVVGALRPDLPDEVRSHLRAAAEHILRFLEDENSSPPPKNVKSTLQKRQRHEQTIPDKPNKDEEEGEGAL